MHKRTQRKKHGALQRLYAAVILLLAIAILLLFVLVLFHTRTISIEGTQYSTKEEIESWIQEDPGAKNTLYLLARYNMGKPELLPFMDSLTLRLKNPWTVQLTIREKKMIGSVKVGEEYVCFDQDGLVLYTGPAEMDGVPVIEGMEVKKAKLYKKLSVTDKKVFQRILDTTQMLKKCSLDTDRIVSDGKNVTLYFGQICAKLGASDIRAKILQLPAILEKLSGQEGTLQMENYTQDSKYISFRKNVPDADKSDAKDADDTDDPGTGNEGAEASKDEDGGSGNQDSVDRDNSGADEDADGGESMEDESNFDGNGGDVSTRE